MELPVIMPDIAAQRFDCRGCTNCCRDLVVHLTARDREEIDRQRWAGRLAAEPYVRLGRAYVLNHQPQGGCVFLGDDGKCRIHAEHGAAAKPLACQLYPFTLTADAGGIRAGLRFDCPTAARGDGSPLPKHRQSVKRLAKDLGAALPAEFDPAGANWELVKGHPLAGETVERLVAEIDRWIRNRKRPFRLRLAGLHELVHTLGGARLNRYDDERLIELVRMVMADMPNVVEAERQVEPAPPTRRQMKLFYQTIFAHGEYITFQQAMAPAIRGLAYRWGQLRRARRLASGSGEIPPLGPTRGGVEFGVLAGITADPNLATDDCDDLLTRYLRGRIIGRTAFGRGYYGWPFLDGLRSLLLAVAAIGWLVRYVAATDGRTAYHFGDLTIAVGIVDRTAGRAAELGAKSAWLRVQYLSQARGLWRLSRAYPLLG